MTSEVEAPRTIRFPFAESSYPAVLLVLASVALLVSIPYSVAVRSQLPGYQNDGGAAEAMGFALELLVLLGVIRLGLRLGPSVGLGWPPLEGWGEETIALGPARGALLTAALLGAAVGLGLGVFGALTPEMFPMRELEWPPWWASALASVGAGIHEELLFRLGVMTVLARVTARLEGRDSAGPETIWVGNLLAAVLFGAAHLPLAGALGTLTPVVIAIVIGMNALVGLACGWLYWRKGLFAAMVAHTVVDLVLKVALPILG